MTFTLDQQKAEDLLSNSGFKNWKSLYKKMRCDRQGSLHYINEARFGFLLAQMGARDISYEETSSLDWSCILEEEKLAFDVLTANIDGHTTNRLKVFEELDKSLVEDDISQVGYIGPNLRHLPESGMNRKKLVKHLRMSVATWKSVNDAPSCIYLETEDSEVISCAVGDDRETSAEWVFSELGFDNDGMPIHTFCPPMPSIERLRQQIHEKEFKLNMASVDRIVGIGIHVRTLNDFEDQEFIQMISSINHNISFVLVADDWTDKPCVFFREKANFLGAEKYSSFFRKQQAL